MHLHLAQCGPIRILKLVGEKNQPPWEINPVHLQTPPLFLPTTTITIFLAALVVCIIALLIKAALDFA